MSETALSVAFFDADHRRHGLARSGTTLLFEDSRSSVLGDGTSIESAGENYRVAGTEGLALELAPVAPAVELPGLRVHVCRAEGRTAGGPVRGLGTVSETVRPPAWDELDALRALSILVDEQTALLALARRPRGAQGHGQELVSAALVQGGELFAVEDARISTVYDGEGRQRSAGLELWLPGEDFPRRGSGTVAAGSSLELTGLRVHAAVFRWRLEEREGYGQYEIAVRSETPEAA